MTFVSVLLPVYNGARYLESASRSILNQTHHDLELIVLDDGSTDDSVHIAARLGDSRVRLVRNEKNLGLPATLNRGLRVARGMIVARQDADDLSHPLRLERQVKFLDSNPDVGLVGTQAWVIDDDGRCIGSVDHALHHETLQWELAFDNAFVHSSVAFRRDLALADKGGYDETSGYNEDYDLWVRLSRATRLANLPDRWVAWRAHNASKTRRTAASSSSANRQILARSFKDVIEQPTSEVLELVVRAQEGMNVDELRRLLPLLETWKASYRAAIGSTARADFQEAIARQYLRLAFARRGRTPSRVVRALSAGRSEWPALFRGLLALIAERGLLALRRPNLQAFDGRVRLHSRAEA